MLCIVINQYSSKYLDDHGVAESAITRLLTAAIRELVGKGRFVRIAAVEFG